MADQRQGEVDDPLRQAAGVHDLAGEHEERHRHEREAVGAVDDVLGDDLGVEHVELQHQGDAAEQQRVGDRHAQRHRTQERSQKDQDDHRRPLTGSWSADRFGGRVLGRELLLQLLEFLLLLGFLDHHQLLLGHPAGGTR